MIATNDSILYGTRGKLGSIVTRVVNGKTVVSRLPESDCPQTVVQKNNRGQFREASAFAKAAMRDPEIKTYFQREAIQRKLPNAYTAALSFKLKDLKTPAQQKEKSSEVKEALVLSPAVQHQEAGDGMSSADANQFGHSYRRTLDSLEVALEKVNMVWDNFKAMKTDLVQKEFMQTALRLRIEELLRSIQRTSKATAIEFRPPMPDLERLNTPVKEVEK